MSKDRYEFAADRPLEQYHKSDSVMMALIILMCGLGIFTLSACAQNYALRMFHDPLYFVKRQAICMGIGLAVLILFASLKMRIIRKSLPVIVIGALALCLLTFIPGLSVEKNGASRWIRMPFKFSLQPSEIAKFAVVLFLANLFDKQAAIPEKSERDVFPAVVGLAAFVLIIFFQKDFSTGLFIFAVGLIMFFETGMKLFWLLPVSPLAILSMVLMVALEPYRMERIIGFLRPDQNVHTFNYQSLAAKRAISAGGFWGSGIGSGIVWSTKIPEVQADYIFAGWTEAMGLIGVLLYFVLLCLFAWRGYRIALQTQNRFASYGAFGCVTVIFLQSLMNCGVVCGVLPTTGIPLPFFSLGGTSVIVTMAMCGFILNASRGETDEYDEISEDDQFVVNNQKIVGEENV